MSSRFVGILLAIASGACPQGVPAPAAPKVIATGNIEGIVVDARTGEPLGGATITLHSGGAQSSPGQSFSPKRTTSTPHGHFVLEDVLAGRFRIFAEREGYVSTEYGATTPGSPGKLVELTGERDIGDIAFRLQPESVIAGQVTDEEGKRIRGLMVRAFRLVYEAGRRHFVPAGAAITSVTGEYRIIGFAPGRYYVMATSPPSAKADSTKTYIPAFCPAEENARSAAPIEVRTGTELPHVDIMLRMGEVTAIRGRVTNAVAMEPASGAVVNIVPAEFSDVSVHLRRNAITDDAGRFEIADVRPGSYMISAEMFDGDTRYSAMDTMSARNPAADVVLQLSPASPLHGRVREEQRSEPLRSWNVEVTLQSFTDPALGQIHGKTNEDGTFEFKNVSPGRFAVAVSALPEGMYVKGLRYGDRDLTSSTVTISSGINLPLEVLLAASNAGASGVVLDGDGEPVPGALVALIPDQSRQEYDYLYRATTADDNGRFSFAAVAPGEYSLFSWRNSADAGFRDSALLKQMERYGVSIDLTNTNSAPVELRVVPGGG